MIGTIILFCIVSSIGLVFAYEGFKHPDRSDWD